MRRTNTSTEVKNRWNAEHYDAIRICVPKGAREEIAAAAAKRGMSVAGYIKHLIMSDTDKDEVSTLRTGGGLISTDYAARQRSDNPLINV